MTNSSKAVFRVVIDGSIEKVWHELTKQGEPQAAVFNSWLHAQSLGVGQNLQMRTRTGQHVIVVGKITSFEPPHRFAHTFRFAQHDDPECEVIYELKQLPAGVECTLVVDRMPMGTKTAKSMQTGGTMILETLKRVVETGRPSLSIRIMYWFFDHMEFVLPARTRSEKWPLGKAQGDQ